ncbi:MAG: hypothetical protein IPM89_02465 [Candidatus Competibacteraceae bacterium]|nr:MAG: hypothetical protein IPM89_02465 [Candidatus Competibacteraceae bacterium]
MNAMEPVLSESDHARGLNLPIDVFLRSLADDQTDQAIGVILSGTGSDGMRGIRAIKGAGGMVMVQSEESAKFDGMPRAALSTGLADFTLPPDEMPRKLVSFVRHPYAAKADRRLGRARPGGWRLARLARLRPRKPEDVSAPGRENRDPVVLCGTAIVIVPLGRGGGCGLGKG